MVATNSLQLPLAKSLGPEWLLFMINGCARAMFNSHAVIPLCAPSSLGRLGSAFAPTATTGSPTGMTPTKSGCTNAFATIWTTSLIRCACSPVAVTPVSASLLFNVAATHASGCYSNISCCLSWLISRPGSVSVRAKDDSGSWEDTYTGTFCIENLDEHGHTCSQYVAAGYTCATMMGEFNYDCRCACE